jgi:hypothetical protein
MRRRLLELCLLAYPRAVRRRDAVYLRDLALDLGASHGTGRQAGSLLIGGMRERIVRGRPARLIPAGAALAALTIGALALVASDSDNHDVDRYACGGHSQCTQVGVWSSR